ncbi:GPO family capsid scaffolding protein [Plesiomonas shigelloides]|uniref:Putative capsid scaffolding protein GpO n=1 Tax=Plesiomonas shigelloides 302-73 TaxID=1315976 RepID=R8AND5_PLESH|nr:GPO family capsid scaffolding protein [Plesiomonas shigelloides]EON87825.1 putative capsid scaffolding protein GpO [Plesiomonas shigelloides 302-73]KAB7666350.1 capsid protein [Plesiomonas shigelloides]KAB7668118.1 capsid protein [Plesiomonas shigelloides]KAB7696986.1 capsid protein [Plesiomonas shigelloides]
MATKSKRFRIGVEGATTDGRKILREWLTQMAENYDPEVYGARVNVEHIKSYSPDGSFGRYGDVTGLFAEEIQDGALAGRMALYAEIAPTPELVELNKKGQKVYTSMEVDPEFADLGSAYLVGLAVTDDPASLGTQRLSFSATGESTLANRKLSPHNLFTVAEETVIEFEDVPDQKNTLFTRIRALFDKKQTSDDARFSDVHQAVELCASEVQQTAKQVTELSASLAKVDELESKLETCSQQLDELTTRLNTEDSSSQRRPFSTGGSHSPSEQTNC